MFLQADFLKGLPSHDENNFAKYHTDASCKSSVSLILRMGYQKDAIKILSHVSQML